MKKHVTHKEVPSPQDPFYLFHNKPIISPKRAFHDSAPISPKKSRNFDTWGNIQNKAQNSPVVERNHSKNDSLLKLEADIDSFFLSLSNIENYIAIENYVKDYFQLSNVVYWQEIPSIQHLYSPRLKKIAPHNSGIVGFAYFSREKLRIPVAIQHQSFDKMIDGEILNPKANIILFPLSDDKNNIVGIVQCVLKPGEFHFPDIIDEFITVFSRKFRSFSHWILQPPSLESFIIGLVDLMEIEQLLLYLQHQITSFFKCRSFELWKMNKKTKEYFRYTDHEEIICEGDSGIVGDVLRRDQPTQYMNTRLSSSHNIKTDGDDEEPLLAYPYLPSNGDIVFALVLRGNVDSPVFSISQEQNLKKISQYVVLSYQNSISLSSSKSLNSRDDSLVSTMISSLPLPGARRKSEDYLTQMMISLKKFSKAHRLSFYLVDWASRVANAIYHKGLVSPIKQQIGKGNVGISIEKGVTINLADAYEDPNFDASIDMATGFRTKTLLTVPILNTNGVVSAVVQLLNKKDGHPFSKSDADASKVIGTLCLSLMENSSLSFQYEDIHSRFLDVFGLLTDPLSNSFCFNEMIVHFCDHISKSMKSEFCVLYLYDEASDLFRPKNFENLPIQNKDGVFSKTIVTSEGFFLNEIKDEGIISQIGTDSFQAKNYCVVPITNRKSRMIGLIVTFNRSTGYNPIDVQLLGIYSSIFTYIINEEDLNQFIKNGELYSDLVKWISYKEKESICIPEKLKINNDINSTINSLNYCSLEYDYIELFQVGYHTFYHLGLMSAFKINSETLFKFLFKVKKLHKNIPFNNFARALDRAQFMFFMIQQAHVDQILRPHEVLAIIVSCICGNIGYSVYNDTMHISDSTPESVLYGSSIISTRCCQLLIEVASEIAALLSPDMKSEFWRISIHLTKSTEFSNNMDFVDKARNIIKTSTLDLSNTDHRTILMMLLFKASNLSLASRPYPISEKWHECQALEWFELGKLEMEHHMSFSSRHNTPQLYDKSSAMAGIIETFANPLFEVLSSMLADLRVCAEEVQRNYALYKSLKKSS